jgi:hypothetical protein
MKELMFSARSSLFVMKEFLFATENISVTTEDIPVVTKNISVYPVNHRRRIQYWKLIHAHDSPGAYLTIDANSNKVNTRGQTPLRNIKLN